MRKALLFFMLLLVSLRAVSQSITLTTLTPACDSNGVVVATFHGMALPITVNWNYGFSSVSHTIYSGNFDTLYGYTGAPMTVSVPYYATSTYMSAPPFTYTVTTTNGHCPAMGMVHATVDSGGIAPFYMLWYNKSTGATLGTDSIISVTTGSYGVIITDSAGCVFGSNFNPDNYGVTDTPSFSYGLTTTTANCNNGSASVVAITGGTTPFSYSWSNGESSSYIVGLTSGSYQVTVTDYTGCSLTQSAFVPQSETISISTHYAQPSCADSNGTDTVIMVTGGIPPYKYTWSNGSTFPTVIGLPSGSYNVIVTDSMGCSGSHTDVLTSPSTITATYVATATPCNAATGSVILTVSSPLSPYTTLWDTYPIQRGDTINNLSSGTYTYYIITNSGCRQSGTVTVPSTDNSIELAFEAHRANCNSYDGYIRVLPIGGATPYTYLWNTGATTNYLRGISAGDYVVTITDSNGCTKSKSISLPDSSTLGVGLIENPLPCIYNSDGNILATAYGGTPPYTLAWNTGATTTYIAGLASGFYSVTVTDFTGCTVGKNTYMWYNPYDSSCFCTIKGKVYHNATDSCTIYPGAMGIPNMQMYLSGVGYTYTDANGNYSYMVTSGSYNISETVLPTYPLSSCQPNHIPFIASAASGCYITINFADSMRPVHDMHISTWDYVKPIPGNTYTQVCIISNEGTQQEAGVVAGYLADGQILEPTVAPAGFFTVTPVYWLPADTMTTLNTGASQVFYMYYNVPDNIPLNTSVVFQDTVSYSAPLSNWAADYTPANNTNYFTTTITDQSPANFKEVYPTGTGPYGIITYADSILEYMIHFTNTSGSTAQNIVIVDTISPNLRFNTLTPIYESAPCHISLSNSGVAQFAFNNINLPAGSSGMLTYTVKLVRGLSFGAQFLNTASIYYDNSLPVTTNTTINSLDGTLAVNAVKLAQNRSMVLYPNPANASFNALINSESDCSAVMNVVDISGRVLITKNISLNKGAQTIPINIASLSAGMYYVVLNSDGIATTQKLVITK